MKSRKPKKLFSTFVGALLLAAIPGLALAGGNRHHDDDALDIYVFGDSLSDPGNVYAIVGQSATAPYAVIPSLPYDIRGHRFTNGRTWAERVAKRLDDAKGGKPAVARPGRFRNYAFGGARLLFNPAAAVPGSSTQIQMFFGDHGAAEPDALYIHQFGGNDIRAALVLAATDFAASIQLLDQAAAVVANDIQTLYAAGARNFLIANAPNLEHAPAVKLAGADVVAGILSATYNGFLDGQLLQMEAQLADASIIRLDMAAFINDVVADPDQYGFRNTETPCLSFMTEIDTQCDKPRRYLFWDGIHPTAAGHRALANAAMEALGEFNEDNDDEDDDDDDD